MKKPERRLFVSVACAAALMVCGAVMMHLDKKPDEATFFAMDCPCTAAVYGGCCQHPCGNIRSAVFFCKLYALLYKPCSFLRKLKPAALIEP